jgi:hypothetical protein
VQQNIASSGRYGNGKIVLEGSRLERTDHGRQQGSQTPEMTTCFHVVQGASRKPDLAL